MEILISWNNKLNGIRCCYKEVNVKVYRQDQNPNRTIICEEEKFKNNYRKYFSQQWKQNKFIGSCGSVHMVLSYIKRCTRYTVRVVIFSSQPVLIRLQTKRNILFIHYLLYASSVLGTVLGLGDLVENKQTQSLSSWSLIVQQCRLNEVCSEEGKELNTMPQRKIKGIRISSLEEILKELLKG